VKRELICCLVLLLSPMLLRAQIANNTSLVGTVVDSSGGVISNSEVSAIEENTKVLSSGVTNAEGYYAITFIQPGTYDITVEDPGFKKMTKTGVVVPVDQAVRTSARTLRLWPPTMQRWVRPSTHVRSRIFRSADTMRSTLRPLPRTSTWDPRPPIKAIPLAKILRAQDSERFRIVCRSMASRSSIT
jgi:hypothetical protein